MKAYNLLIYSCIALAMAANVTATIRDLSGYTGNWTQPDMGNSTAETIGTKDADDIYPLKLINETAPGPSGEQTAGNADKGNDAKVFEIQPQLANIDEVQANRATAMKKIALKGRAIRKLLLKLLSEIEKLDETKATKDKVEEKKHSRKKRESKAWDFASDSSFDQCHAPAEFEPTSAKPYRAFGTFEVHQPSLLGHRKRHQHAILKKLRHLTEAVANLDKDTGAYANEYESKFQQKMHMPGLAMDTMTPFAMDHDNVNSHAGSQTAAYNMGQMKREGNEKVGPYAYYQEPIDYFMNIQTYDKSSARKLNKNKDNFGLWDESNNDAALPNTYALGRILHKNHLAHKVPRYKRAHIHRIAPGGVLMIINGEGKLPEPRKFMQRVLPLALKLRNGPLKTIEEQKEALQPEKATSKPWPIARLLKFGDILQQKLALGESQSITPKALTNTELHVHDSTDATCQMPNVAAEWGQDYGKYNQLNVETVNDERMGAALEETNPTPEVNSFFVPQAKNNVNLNGAVVDLIEKSLKTLTKSEQRENLDQEIQEVCPMHDSSKANRAYGKGMVCSCRILNKRKYKSEPKKLI